MGHEIQCQEVLYNECTTQITIFLPAGQTHPTTSDRSTLPWSGNQWKPVLVDKIAKKANASLGMLQRNLRFCPETCRKTAYTSHVRSLLEYSSTVWDPHVQKEIDKIEGIQRRAAIYIKRDYQSRNPGCVTAMLQELDLPSLQERRWQNRLTFLFKIIEGHLPGIKAEKHLAPILNKRLIRPTRSENQKNVVQQFASNHQRCFHIQHASTPVIENSFFPRTIREWNNLDSSVVSAGTVGEFKTLLQRSSQRKQTSPAPPPPPPHPLPHFSSNPPLSPSLALLSCPPTPTPSTPLPAEAWHHASAR